jgi:hypothetical protein
VRRIVLQAFLALDIFSLLSFPTETVSLSDHHALIMFPPLPFLNHLTDFIKNCENFIPLAHIQFRSSRLPVTGKTTWRMRELPHGNNTSAIATGS